MLLLFVKSVRKFLEGEHLGETVNQTSLERVTIEGNSPVGENSFTLLDIFLEYLEKRKPRGNQAELIG